MNLIKITAVTWRARMKNPPTWSVTSAHTEEKCVVFFAQDVYIDLDKVVAITYIPPINDPEHDFNGRPAAYAFVVNQEVDWTIIATPEFEAFLAESHVEGDFTLDHETLNAEN